MTKVKLGFVIGRFCPLHAGHRDMIRKAYSQCDMLLILIGSANVARNIKTPFTYEERAAEMLLFLNHEDLTSTEIYPVNDNKYSDNTWISDVTDIVNSKVEEFEDVEVILFGHNKHGTQYLNWFPQYKFISIDASYSVCSTDIRTEWFNKHPEKFTPEVVNDWKYFQKEKELFKDYPFPETLNFSCSDALLECAGHILLIQRGRVPGEGTWALPGGFKNSNETFFDCALRELIEETNVRIPEKVLRGSVVHQQLFDSPTRGNGIPRVTMCVHIKVNPEPSGALPRANGADDAIVAQWFPLHTVMNELPLFDDHKSIISTMTGIMPIAAHRK